MAAERVSRFRIIFTYVVPRHLASLVFNAEGTMRIEREKGRCDGESQPRFCAGIEEGIHHEGAELRFAVLDSEVQWRLFLDVCEVDVAALLVFQ